MLKRLACLTVALVIAAIMLGVALFILSNTPAVFAQGDLPDMDALGRYHFEYGTTQGWFAQPDGSLPTANIIVTATTATAWSGSYSLRVGVSSTPGDGWSAAAGLDDPAPGMAPTGTLTAHLYLPVASPVTWARLYILDQNWDWAPSSDAALQPGQWVTLTWNISPTVTRPIHRFGVQFGGNTTGPLDDVLYLDAIEWSHPVYTHSIYTGAYLSGTWTANFPNELNCLDDMGGKHAGLINVFVGWTGPFPSDIVNTILCHESTPLITWEPWVSLPQITAGAYVTYIDEWAQAISQTHSLVFLRWGHEMNGNWYTWWSGDPDAYKAAWRYVHDRVEITNNVKNAVWVWTPNHQSVPNEPWNDYHNYYPGDGYVDWVGASGFNAAQKAWWDPKPPCLTFDDLFSPILSDMAGRYQKPQMVAEFASACDNGCDKALWITEAYHHALFHPRLQALVWFNVAKWEGEGAQRQWVDWRLGCGDCDAPACPDCVTAYAQALSNPRYSALAPGPTICKLYLPLVLKSHN